MRATGQNCRYVAHDVDSGLTEYPFIQRSIEYTHPSLCAGLVLHGLAYLRGWPKNKKYISRSPQ